MSAMILLLGMEYGYSSPLQRFYAPYLLSCQGLCGKISIVLDDLVRYKLVDAVR